MGFKLTQRVIREFRPLFAHPKRGAVRDPLIETILIHFADRTEQRREGSENPVRESGSTISKLGIADQTGLSLSVVEQRVKTLEEMGVLVVEQRLDKNIKQYAVDLSRLSEFNEKPFSSPSDGGVIPATQAGNSIPVSRVTTYPSHGHNKTLVDPLIDPSSNLSSPPNSSEEVASQTEAQSTREEEGQMSGDDRATRDGEGDHASLHGFTVEQLLALDRIRDAARPEDLPENIRRLLSLASRTSEEESPAPAPEAPQRGAQELQHPEPHKARQLAWRPHPEVWEAMKAKAPDIDLELVLVTYIAWCKDNNKPMTNSGYTSWVERRQTQAAEARREREERERKEALAGRSWAEKMGIS